MNLFFGQTFGVIAEDFDFDNPAVPSSVGSPAAASSMLVGPGNALIGPDGGLVGPGGVRYPVEKRLKVAVFDKTGAYLGTWHDYSSVPSFNYPINGSQGAMELILARSWGNAGEPGDSLGSDDLLLGNKIVLTVIDRESAPDGVILYQGIIRRVRTLNSGSGFSVMLVPIGASFGQRWVSDSLAGGMVVPQTQAYNLINANYAPGITWDPTNVIPAELTYVPAMERMFLEQVFELYRKTAGGWWYTRVNPDQTFAFKKSEKPFQAPRHRIKVSSLASVEFSRSSVERRRRVFVYGYQGKDDNDVEIDINAVVSRANYNPLVDSPSDFTYSNSRITDQITAQGFAYSYLQFLDTDILETVITVPDSNYDEELGYNIESLLPGETVRLFDRHNQATFPVVPPPSIIVGDGTYPGGLYYAQVLRTLVIAEVKYEYTRATVTLKTKPNRIAEELLSVSNRMLLQETKAQS